jgi:predicted nucleotidyltransferase
MKTTSEYLRLLKQFKETKGASYGIQKIGLFGSVARGEQKEGSDVDVCFEGKAMGLFLMARLKSELEALFGTTVDLLRMRKQLDGSVLKESVMQDIIYA